MELQEDLSLLQRSSFHQLTADLQKILGYAAPAA
jgi:hypothetical protein